jgi:hypothetical protein
MERFLQTLGLRGQSTNLVKPSGGENSRYFGGTVSRHGRRRGTTCATELALHLANGSRVQTYCEVV